MEKSILYGKNILNKFVISDYEKLEATDYWKRKFPRVNGVTFIGEPMVDGHMLCVGCGERDIYDDAPIWHCRNCGKLVIGTEWKM